MDVSTDARDDRRLVPLINTADSVAQQHEEHQLLMDVKTCALYVSRSVTETIRPKGLLPESDEIGQTKGHEHACLCRVPYIV
jgi:hypothetical protein